jgi:hypothetical protein
MMPTDWPVALPTWIGSTQPSAQAVSVIYFSADRHRAVAGEFDHAIALAEAILRADAAADFGHGRGRV